MIKTWRSINEVKSSKLNITFFKTILLILIVILKPSYQFKLFFINISQTSKPKPPNPNNNKHKTQTILEIRIFFYLCTVYTPPLFINFHNAALASTTVLIPCHSSNTNLCMLNCNHTKTKISITDSNGIGMYIPFHESFT